MLPSQVTPPYHKSSRPPYTANKRVLSAFGLEHPRIYLCRWLCRAYHRDSSLYLGVFRYPGAPAVVPFRREWVFLQRNLLFGVRFLDLTNPLCLCGLDGAPKAMTMAPMVQP